MPRNDRLLVAFTAALLVVFVTLFTLILLSVYKPGPEWIGFWGNVFGGALGAFATVLAIAATYRLASAESRRQAQERQLEGRAIAILIAPAVIVLRDRLHELSEKLAEEAAAEWSELLPTNKEWVAAREVKVPTLIMDRLDRLHLMRPGAAPILQLVALLDQYEEKLNIWRNHAEGMFDCKVASEDLLTVIQTACHVVDRAETEVIQAHDAEN